MKTHPRSTGGQAVRKGIMGWMLLPDAVRVVRRRDQAHAILPANTAPPFWQSNTR